MATYTPPLRDMQFVLHELLNVTEEFKALPAHAEVDADTINAVLEEGGKFASAVLAPLNRGGDEQGCKLNLMTHEVTVPTGFKDAYAKYVEGGWPALSCDPKFGGQGLPISLNQCFYEMLNSANQAWTMYPGLTHGAYECLHEHGTPEQKQMFLPKLTSGEWTGTMCLTEPHCGTDLGMLRTKAEPQPDGTYRIMGQKIFISAGMQSLGLTEVDWQSALAYAKDRIQMRSLSGPKAKDKPADPIIVHPDVRKMILTAKAYAEGGRALSLYCAFLIDRELHHPDQKVRKESAELVALLTPIVKAFITDNGWTATSA